MRRLLAAPRERAPWYNATGVTAYVTAALVTAFALRAIVAPGQGLPVAPGMVALDIPFMVAVAIACLPVFVTGNTIARWEGVVFVLYYVAYTAYLILTASEHALLPQFQSFMLWFVVPLTVLTVAVSLYREYGLRRAVASQ